MRREPGTERCATNRPPRRKIVIVGANPLRDLLNRLRWDEVESSGGVVLGVRSRVGGEERIEPVAFASIVAILTNGVRVADGTFLPYHRIVTVRRGDDVLWDVRRRGDDGET